ncbi:phytanoyl-CoA dioxygenase family protein [Streptomyces halobius]|uniref:Phytanoyl-CoA dioxygenase family protein n=1 Tax=Streptomyces halobius TaxID=2879846 RepID=A0ABY4MLZ7_9ACTN|nr:phytanoyl-CoA dioxygenase family protein [Streptomyces halobius]UQA97351.1 phytanoyl-CoA dioxygenase family protein [Streptomyces halobius]
MTARTDPITADVLTDEARRYYEENGFVRIPQVLSASETERFRAASEELMAQHGPEIWGAGEDAVQVHFVAQAWLKHEALRDLALHPAITGIAKRLAGAPLRLYSTDILLKAGQKTLTTLPTLVHDDETGLPLDGLDRTLTAWVALVDVPIESGCLSYVPGSHLRDAAHRQTHMTSFAEHRAISDIWPDYAWQPRITVPLKAGDVAFHHCRTVHMAGPNLTDSPRMGHGIVYMDADTTYRPGTEDAHISHLAPGDPLNNEKFPLV